MFFKSVLVAVWMGRDGLSGVVNGGTKLEWVPRDLLRFKDLWPVYGVASSSWRLGKEVFSIPSCTSGGAGVGFSYLTRVSLRIFGFAVVCFYNVGWVELGVKLYDVIAS